MSESDLALALTALDADYYNKTVNDETTSNTVVEESESIRAA
jgi:hypothetical protein